MTTPTDRSVDPVTGTPEGAPPSPGTRPQTPEELQEAIQRTRARMSGTLDAIEHRMSPERLERRARETFTHQMDEIRHRMNPKRLARNAGNNMFETIRDNPAPATVAGLSIAYLLYKAASDSDSEVDYEPRYGYGYDEAYHREPSRTEHLKEQAQASLEQTRHTIEERAHTARDQLQRTGRQVRRRGRSAANDLASFIHDNPLAAGAIAVGVGALIGGLLPRSTMEDQVMGPASETVTERARQVAVDAKDRALEASERPEGQLEGVRNDPNVPETPL